MGRMFVEVDQHFLMQNRLKVYTINFSFCMVISDNEAEKSICKQKEKNAYKK